MTSNNQSWGTRVGLILAMAGNSVGLGNFLRFPVQAIQNGGGSFIIPYLVCFLLLGIPLLYVEWASGRFGGQRGNHSTPFILAELNKKKFWLYIGVFGLFSNIAVAAYYSYLESWTLNYLWDSITGTFSNMSSEQVSSYFDEYVSLNNSTPFIFWLLCLLLNTWILSRGLSGGVEIVAKIGMPLLILFGIALAIRGVTLQAGENGALFDGIVGLNFLWTPDFSTIWNPKVWLAAAGQIFFTLSVGMGSVQCYASYLKKEDDVALNAMSAGWMNEFVEVVIGGAIIIPIAVGYLGIDNVVEITKNGGLGLGFRTLPYLFQQWGPILAIICGIFWFGLLFFAGITSSLAMGTSVTGFLQDEYNFSKQKAAWIFGFIILILGFPTVLFFNEGVFDEYDYWAGTISLVVFAMAETILFAWVFGIDNAYAEITRGADIKVHTAIKFILKYITTFLLIAVFMGSLLAPASGDWLLSIKNLFAGQGWQFSDGSIIGQLFHQGLYNQIANTSDTAIIESLNKKRTYLNLSRILLLLLYMVISYFVYKAYKKRLSVH